MIFRFDGQYRFHPTKYVERLACTIPGAGCHLFEHSRVTDWSPTHLATEGGMIGARRVVMATHLPLGEIGGHVDHGHGRIRPGEPPSANAIASMRLSHFFL